MIGRKIAHYEIVAKLGEGGMGEVYRARDTRLDRTVAIKVLRSGVADDPARLQRFEQEARAASALNHPNILTIYDVGRTDGTDAAAATAPYIAMEWVDGDSLRALLARGRMPMRQLVDVAHQLAEGLAKAHAAGIVHRDLKPENVMVSADGFVKIVDFGLAKLMVGADSAGEMATAEAATAIGVVMGTVGYMSPEQASGRPVDHRSDQFAFGLLVYEMATGRQPFRRDTAAQSMAAAIDAEAPAVRELNPEVPEHLAFVIDRCLKKSARDRYDSTRDLARDVGEIRAGLSGRGASASSQRAGARRSRPAWVLLVAALLAGAVLGGAAWAITKFWNRGSTETVKTEAPLVAVRPFRNLTAEGAQEHFAVGMTEEIRGQLSKIAALRLLSGAAVQKYATSDIAALASDLGVNGVVDGSVRLDQNRVRVSVELVDARTGQLRWSDTYERQIADVFAVQSEIALQVARALQANLSPAEQARVKKPPTDNMEAYDLYLQARRAGSPGNYEANVAGMKLLEQAIALDPKFAVAKSYLAYRIFFLNYRGDTTAVDRAIAMAQDAAEIDPTLAYAPYVLGSAYSMKGIDSKARLGFMRALELDPSFTNAMNNLSFHEYRFGRLEDSLMWARRQFPLSDRTGNAYYHVAIPLLALRDDERSLRWMTDAARRAPAYTRVEYMLAYAEYQNGDGAAALARLRRAAERWPADEEVASIRAELAYITGAPDAEALAVALSKATSDIVGGVLGLGGRVRLAYFLKKRGDARWAKEAECRQHR